MKKKLKLGEIKVDSFITKLGESQANIYRGGTRDTGNTTELMTEFSCMAYISCNPAACLVTHDLCNQKIDTSTKP